MTTQKDKRHSLMNIDIASARFGTTLTSLIQGIDCPRKRFFPYRFQFSRHILLDR